MVKGAKGKGRTKDFCHTAFVREKCTWVQSAKFNKGNRTGNVGTGNNYEGIGNMGPCHVNTR